MSVIDALALAPSSSLFTRFKMMLAGTPTMPATIPSVSGVTTPTIHPQPTAALMAASVAADAANHNQKDTTFTKIFVGGLPYHTTDKSLREHFEVYGEIDEAVVITDRQTGKSRGYGFVSMAFFFPFLALLYLFYLFGTRISLIFFSPLQLLCK